MSLYLFVRADVFYPIELRDDADARANAECNPGTVRVENVMTKEIVWPVPYNAEGDETEEPAK